MAGAVGGNYLPGVLSGMRRLAVAAFLAVLLVVTVISGWISLEEGTHRFLWPLTGAVTVSDARAAVEALRANPETFDIRGFSAEVWGLSELVSPRHFSESRLIDHGIYYAEMPVINQWLLLVHILLAVFCMLFGALQFWPWFRKRYMRLHRLIGAGYIITVPPAVLTSLAYLALTAPHHIYDHLVAWVALWAFGILAVVAVFMAVRALRTRRIHEHQAWMAISFGCLLVAPLLRWNWVWLAWLFPGIDQETLNLVTMGVMLPQCLLIIYALILINRQYERPMTRRVAHPLSVRGAEAFRRLLPVLHGVALGLTLTTAIYLLGGGMSGQAGFSTLAPALLIAGEAVALQPLLAGGLVLTLGFGLSLALHVFGQLLAAGQIGEVTARTRVLSLAVAACALIAGLLALMVGWRIGLAANNLLFSGGTFYAVNGSVLIAFALFHGLAGRHGQLALMKESLVFLLALLPFPALFFLTSLVVRLVGLPADYLAAGQGFVLPAGFSAALLFPAIVHVAFSQATREHN